GPLTIADLSGGTVILTAANTYTGATTVSGGTLNVQGSIASTVVNTVSGTALNVSGSLTGNPALTNAGITTFSSASQTLASINGAGTIHLSGPTALTAGSGNYTGIIDGGGSLTKTTTGTLTLTGANAYSGGTTVSAGTLQGTTTGIQGSVVNNANV